MKRFSWGLALIAFLALSHTAFSEKSEGKLLDKQLQQDNTAYMRLMKAKRFTIQPSEGAFTTMGKPTGKPARQPGRSRIFSCC